MADLSYICNVCDKAKFSLDALEEAKKHSKIPIIKGDYHGIILKEEYKRELKDTAYTFLLFIKSREVTEDHNRIYNCIEAIEVTPKLLNYWCKEASKPFPARKTIDIIHFSPPTTWDVNKIDNIIKDKKWVGLDKEEFSKFTEILDAQSPSRIYCFTSIEEFKTL